MNLPNRATPGGCIVGFFGLLSLLLSGFFWRAYYLAGKMDDQERAAELSGGLLTLGTGSAVVGLGIVYISWRMVQRCDMSSPNDPDKPKMRF